VDLPGAEPTAASEGSKPSPTRDYDMGRLRRDRGGIPGLEGVRLLISCVDSPQAVGRIIR